MQLLESHHVPTLEHPIRFQEYSVGIFKTIPTKSGIKKGIKKGIIFIDDQKAATSTFITGGEKIDLYESKTSSTYKRLILDLEVVYEDDFLAIINKPAGILVSGNKFKTVANGLSQNLTKSTQIDAVQPKPTHRLDYPTTGLLLVGKTSKSILALNKLFENKEITKTYFAVTIGKMPANGNIILKVDDKTASSQYTVLKTAISKRFDFLNLVKLQPSTGRRHQLRKHMAAINNPILGDQEYGTAPLILKGKGLYLHAGILEFTHPFTKENIHINKEFPEKFTKLFRLK